VAVGARRAVADGARIAARDPEVEARCDGLVAAGPREPQALGGRRDVGHRRPLFLDREVPVTERGVHRQDLTIAHVADGSRLRDVAPRDRDDDVDIEDRRRARVSEILRRRPDERPAGRRLERRDARGEPAAAEEEVGAGTDAGHERQRPAMRVVRRTKAQEVADVHGATRRSGSRCDPARRRPSAPSCLRGAAWRRRRRAPTHARSPRPCRARR